MSYEAKTCALCGARQGVRHETVRWAEPAAGRTFDSIDRCTDRAACRSRVEAAGRSWPVADPEVVR